MIHLHHAKPLSSAPLPPTLATPGLALARNEQIGGREGGREGGARLLPDGEEAIEGGLEE